MKSSNIRRLLTAPFLALVFSGCALAFDAETLGVPASVSASASEDIQGAEFEVSKKAVYFLFGALRATHPSLENALAGQLMDGSEIHNLRIKVRMRFTDFLLTVLTAGIISSRSVTFEGVVVGGSGN